ncbi:unnamed protein product [Rangifer tarandus platyrhynchus]|uniref:Uncharacterized protein n=1 Tax=Rangifer tarandus platyrhynchus TaxID=3082113 RepID=A0ABN8XM73_RANTA|nr:unnamed protein product [Rangifer tarandus platyrhynchus]
MVLVHSPGRVAVLRRRRSGTLMPRVKFWNIQETSDSERLSDVRHTQNSSGEAASKLPPSVRFPFAFCVVVHVREAFALKRGGTRQYATREPSTKPLVRAFRRQNANNGWRNIVA